MFVLLFYLLVLVSLSTSEFQLLHDQRVPSWTTHISTDPSDCSREELLQNFPDIYGINNGSGDTFGSPRNFTATAFEREAIELGGRKNYYYPGAMISFYPPEFEAENITGYEIRLYKNRELVCLVMDFTERNWPSQRQIEFELFPLFGLAHYQLTITSLPKYDGNQLSDMTDLVTGVFKSYKTEDTVLPPSANWYATIAYYVIDEDIINDTRSVKIVISRPPVEYNFQRFEIVLVPKGGNSGIRKARMSNLYYVFEGVPTGNYIIMMWPVDEYFSQAGRCLCRLADRSCSNCVSTVVDNVIIDELTTS